MTKITVTTFCGTLLLGFLLSCSTTNNVKQITKEQITKEQFLQVKTGMTYDQVREVLGEDGEEISRAELAGTTTVMYRWKNPDGGNMNATFQNGRLVSKAQSGLK